MTDEQFEKAIQRLEEQMIQENQKPRRSHSYLYLKLLVVRDSDPPEIKRLVALHNEKVVEYNSTGRQFASIVQDAIRRNAPRTDPEDDIWGVIDQWLRLRREAKRPLFYDVDSHLHVLERKLHELREGPDGIEALRKRIRALHPN